MSFRIPFAPPRQQWRLAIDTATDLPASGAASVVAGGATDTLAPRSYSVLTATRVPTEDAPRGMQSFDGRLRAGHGRG
jgi:hypothetical protein